MGAVGALGALGARSEALSFSLVALTDPAIQPWAYVRRRMPADVAELLSQHSLVTFRFYAQHAGVPVADAKEALTEYAAANKGKVNTTFLVGGTTKAEGQSTGAMAYKLVAEANLDEAKAQFESVSSCHPYALHAAAEPPTSSEPLYILNQTQDRKLYDELAQGPNCLLDNRWASVKGPAVTQKSRRGAGRPAAPAAPLPSKLSASSSSLSSKQKEVAPAAVSFFGKGKEVPAAPKEEAEKKVDKQDDKKADAKPPASKPGGFAALFGGAAAASKPAAAKPAAAPAASSKKRTIEESDSDDNDDPPPWLKKKMQREAEEKEAAAAKEEAEAAAAAKAKEEEEAAATAARIEQMKKNKAAREAKEKEEKATKAAEAKRKRAEEKEKQEAAAKAKAEAEAEAKAEAEAEAEQAKAAQAEEDKDEAADDEEESGAARKRLKATVGESSASAAAPTTPLSSGSSEEAEAGGRKDGVDMDTMADAALGGGAPASTAAPRTIIVKERVKEERTYQDARGYLVCEEVWVEREVEREVKEAPAKPKASFSQLAQPKAKERPKLTGLKANKGKEAKGMEEVDAEEEEEKKKNKGKGKGKAAPAPAKVVTGAGSIMGFFKKA